MYTCNASTRSDKSPSQSTSDSASVTGSVAPPQAQAAPLAPGDALDDVEAQPVSPAAQVSGVEGQSQGGGARGIPTPAAMGQRALATGPNHMMSVRFFQRTSGRNNPRGYRQLPEGLAGLTEIPVQSLINSCSGPVTIIAGNIQRDDPRDGPLFRENDPRKFKKYLIFSVSFIALELVFAAMAGGWAGDNSDSTASEGAKLCVTGMSVFALPALTWAFFTNKSDYLERFGNESFKVSIWLQWFLNTGLLVAASALGAMLTDSEMDPGTAAAETACISWLLGAFQVLGYELGVKNSIRLASP